MIRHANIFTILRMPRHYAQLQNGLNHAAIKNGPAISCVHTTSIHRSNKDSGDKKSGPISRFEVFKEEHATVILDIEEEREKITSNEQTIEIVDDADEYSVYDQFSQTRKCRLLPDRKDVSFFFFSYYNFFVLYCVGGKTGVYDIEELVDVLKHNNSQDIFVCSVPVDLKWVDHICVVTGRSQRHMRGIANFVRKLFKLKRSNNEVLPKVEGGDSKEWIAMDLGNIALHIFSSEARVKYDLEMLWSVGSKFDPESNKVDEFSEIVNRHTFELNTSGVVRRSKYLPNKD